MDGGISYLSDNKCHISDQVDSKFCQENAWTTWLYFVTKIADLFETMFFVLKKKQSQVTLLHVYHHAIMVIGTRYFGLGLSGSQALIVGGINTIVHSIMYSYYFLSALGPGIKKYLWWKVYLTRLQMAQFIFVICFMIYLSLNQCSLPESMSRILIYQEVSFTILFLNFYYKTYRSNKKNNNLSSKEKEKLNFEDKASTSK